MKKLLVILFALTIIPLQATPERKLITQAKELLQFITALKKQSNGFSLLGGAVATHEFSYDQNDEISQEEEKENPSFTPENMIENVVIIGSIVTLIAYTALSNT